MPQTRQTLSHPAGQPGKARRILAGVIAYRRDIGAGESIPFHHHDQDQLVFAREGVMTITTRDASYVVPPRRAVWMPAGVPHRIDAHGHVAMRTLYLGPGLCAALGNTVSVLNVSPLLRELITTIAQETMDAYSSDARERLVAVILDQIGLQEPAALWLPTPTDPRLKTITRQLSITPADRRTLDEWSRQVGASKRTLNRLFRAQTGMSFREWRQQRCLLRAVELLSSGWQVTAIALELGYGNTSAFIAMFRRALGTTPGNFIQASPGTAPQVRMDE